MDARKGYSFLKDIYLEFEIKKRGIFNEMSRHLFKSAALWLA